MVCFVFSCEKTGMYASSVHCFYTITKLKCHSFLLLSPQEGYTKLCFLTLAGLVTSFISLLSLSILFLSPLSHFLVHTAACLLLVCPRVQSHIAWHYLQSVSFGFCPQFVLVQSIFRGLDLWKKGNKSSCSNIPDNPLFSFIPFISFANNISMYGLNDSQIVHNKQIKESEKEPRKRNK